MTTRDREIAFIEEWLEDKHCTLWAVYDVVNLDTRTQAATWFNKEMHSFFSWLDTRLDG